MTIQPFISEQFNGIIWRMEIDEISETLFLEIRNNEERQVSFCAINLLSCEINFKNLITPEKWLTGIETAYDGVLLLHNYESSSGPSHKGLVAIDALTGETLWSTYTYAFDYLSVNGPVVYDSRFQPRKLFLADVKTGGLTRIYEPDVYGLLKNNVVLPDFVSTDFLSSKLLHLHPFGAGADYLEYNNFRIVSLHTLKGGQLMQVLYIFENNNNLYEDLLTENIQKIQPESFMMHKNRLIYIKNKAELKILSL